MSQCSACQNSAPSFQEAGPARRFFCNATCQKMFYFHQVGMKPKQKEIEITKEFGDYILEDFEAKKTYWIDQGFFDKHDLTNMMTRREFDEEMGVTGKRNKTWKKETVFAKRPLKAEIIPILDYFFKKSKQLYVDTICIILFEKIMTLNTDFLSNLCKDKVYLPEDQPIQKTLGYCVARPLGIIWETYMSEDARLEVDTEKLDKFLITIEEFDLRTLEKSEKKVIIPNEEREFNDLVYKQKKELIAFKEKQAEELATFVKRQEMERDIFKPNFPIILKEAEEAEALRQMKISILLDNYKENWAIWKSQFN